MTIDPDRKKVWILRSTDSKKIEIQQGTFSFCVCILCYCIYVCVYVETLEESVSPQFFFNSIYINCGKLKNINEKEENHPELLF